MPAEDGRLTRQAVKIRVWSVAGRAASICDDPAQIWRTAKSIYSPELFVFGFELNC